MSKLRSCVKESDESTSTHMVNRELVKNRKHFYLIDVDYQHMTQITFKSVVTNAANLDVLQRNVRV